MKNYITIVLISFFIISKGNLSAQTKDTLDYFSLDLEGLMNIKVSSASKMEQTQSEAPNIISLITRDQIDNFGWISANDLLYSLPGFSPSQDYDRRTVSFRGMFEGWNNNHILTLIDGIPFNDNLYGTSLSWEITPLIFAKSFEVVRGPGGALYGTNAMNGVLSINTLSPKDLNGFGEVQIKMGSNNTQIYNFLGGTENDNFGMVYAFNHFETSGNEYQSYDGSGRTDNSSNLLKFKTLDDRSSSYFFTKIDAKKALEGLSFQYHEQHWGYETGHGWLFYIPDRPETMREYRRIICLKYSPRKENNVFNYEISSRYQDHGIDWNMRFFPDNSYEGYFPYGVSEYLKTNAQDIFMRIQGDLNIKNHKILFGVEEDYFYYSGDKAHYANYDMNTWADPDSTNKIFNLNPWFEYIKNKPVNNIGAFAQYISPKLFDKLQLTVSVRYDKQFFDYVDIYETSKPTVSKSFELFTPRVSLVFSPTEKIRIKAIAGKAFKTPSPTEMFGSNTYTLASNIKQLKPEIVNNYDLGIDWQMSKDFNLRANGFYLDFKNQIAYSVANANLSTNLYSLKTAGVEIEGNLKINKLICFINYTYSKRLDESIADSTISINKNAVTWTPSSLANVGLTYQYNKILSTIQLHYQGESIRRQSDFSADIDSYRPLSIDPWVNLNLKMAYSVKKNVKISIEAKNVLNANQYLMKSNAYPFDYRREKLQLLFELYLVF